MSQSVVYFLAVGTEPYDAVKIGYTARINERLSSYRMSNPHGVHLFGTLPGGANTEAFIHRKFKQYLIRGEWFDLTPESRVLLDDMLANGVTNLDFTEPSEQHYMHHTHHTTAFSGWIPSIHDAGAPDNAAEIISALTAHGYPFGNEAAEDRWERNEAHNVLRILARMTLVEAAPYLDELTRLSPYAAALIASGQTPYQEAE